MVRRWNKKNNETDKKKKAELIYELLEMIRATFFRQSMFAEFEKIIHEKVENGETLSSENLNDIVLSCIFLRLLTNK